MSDTATTRPAYRYAAALVRVVDGDTIVFRIDLGFHVHIETPVRILGWSCPELHEPLGPEAKAAAEELLRGATQIIVETKRDTQTFSRWLGIVWVNTLDVNGVELGALLADRGLARLGR